MTYTRMVELLAEETGYPEKMVRHILDVQGQLITRAMVNREEVHLPRVLKLKAETQKFRWGDRTEERIVLRVRPMKPLRKELNTWTSTE